MPLGTVVPCQLAESTDRALHKLKDALGGDVGGYVANRLHFSADELNDALAAEQVDGIALAMYNIEKRAQSVIIGDQTGIGKGRQAAAMIRYGLLSGYLPVFFTDRYTLFSDMYRDCKALGIKDARPLVVNSGVSVVDFDIVVEEKGAEAVDEIWSPESGEEDEDAERDAEMMGIYQKQYEVVYKSPQKKILQRIIESGDIPSDAYDYLMVTYSQLKDARRDLTRVEFLQSLCEKHRVLFIFDEAHRSSSVSSGKISVITQSINMILSSSPQSQCVFLSATFAKRPESLITFMRRTALSALATESTLEAALHAGGVPMQEYVSTCLAAEGQMIRREHSSEGLPLPTYTYLDEDLALHSEMFDKVMFYFRDIVKLSCQVSKLAELCAMAGLTFNFRCYPARAQLFYINKVLLLSLKARRVAQTAIKDVRKGRSVVIGMSDTLECVLQDVRADEDGTVRGDFSTLLLRLLHKTVRDSADGAEGSAAIFDLAEGSLAGVEDVSAARIKAAADEVRNSYYEIMSGIGDDVFHLPMSPIDVIRQLIERESFETPDGEPLNIRFEECTGRAHSLEYLSPDGDDDFVNARIMPRRKRHSNHIFNDFQNNRLDVILINACGAIGASAHAVSTADVPDDRVRQRKMLIVQNDLDVNIDLQKRGRINRTGQREDLPPLYEYIITAIPSEKRLNMMLRAKLRSLSANTAAWQDQGKDQADFIDISNKYGNEVASEYIADHPETALVLGLGRKVTASRLLARIAMLGVAAQQEIVDDLMTAYTTLEAELRRLNQWDLERDYRDFEAEFVREELFTTAKADSPLGGCSYLTTYKCRQKTFPYSYEALMRLCDTSKTRYGSRYADNAALQKEVRKYYAMRYRLVRERYAERRAMLYERTKLSLVKYCGDDALADDWLRRACKPYDSSGPDGCFTDVSGKEKAGLVIRKLISFSNEWNSLLDREKADVKKYAEERKRLLDILSRAEIGKGYADVSEFLSNEDCPQRVRAVLYDIRFGKDDRTRFLPSKVELVFALTAVAKEIHINLVHNAKWSNYERLKKILDSRGWSADKWNWNGEIARYNNRIVQRRIITGNILGAYVHPAISALKPRFISFSLKNASADEKKTQIGLLLPMDEAKIRETLKTVTVPLNEGLKYAVNVNTCYTIAGLGVNFSLLPCRGSEGGVKFLTSVQDIHSKDFENDRSFDSIRQFFRGRPLTSAYGRGEKPGQSKRSQVMHYQTEMLPFESATFQTIMQSLSQMDAVIIVPRDQMSYGDIREFSSRSEREADEPWPALNWRDSGEVPMPPVRERLLLRISAPIVKGLPKGRPVTRHSDCYILAAETLALSGLPLERRSTTDALRLNYLGWKKQYYRSISNNSGPAAGEPREYEQLKILVELRQVTENRLKAQTVSYSVEVTDILQKILDSEYLDSCSLCLTEFEERMLFLSPDKSEVQAFLDAMPCSPQFDGIRKCLLDYIEGRTDMVNSPSGW